MLIVSFAISPAVAWYAPPRSQTSVAGHLSGWLQKLFPHVQWSQPVPFRWLEVVLERFVCRYDEHTTEKQRKARVHIGFNGVFA